MLLRIFSRSSATGSATLSSVRIANFATTPARNFASNVSLSTEETIASTTDQIAFDNQDSAKGRDTGNFIPIKSRTQILKRGNHSLYNNYAPVLFEWSQKLISGELQLDSLVKSKKYEEVSRAICDTTRHSDKNILNLIKSLVLMGVDPESRLVQFLENELLIKLKHYDLRLLVSTYQIYQSPIVATSSPLRGQIVDSLNRNINERLDSVNASLVDLLQLIKHSRCFSAEILIKIEDQVTCFLDANEDVSLDQLCYLIVLLSRHNRRNKPLIRAVVSKLLKFRPQEVYSMPPHLVHMVSSLNRLNFPEINLLEKCSDILINLNFLENENESPRRDFIVAISQFNFFYPKLLDYYIQKLLEKPEIFKHQDFVTLAITLARLDYRTEESMEVLQTKIIPKCFEISDFTSKQQYFNFIYSLCLLGIAPNDYLRTVCNRQFLSSLEAEEMENYLSKIREQNARQQKEVNEESGGSEQDTEEASSAEPETPVSAQDIYNVMSLRRKYLLISGLLLRGESGNDLDSIFETTETRSQFEQFVHSLEFEVMKRSKDLQTFRENIFKTMETFAPLEKYMLLDRKTPYGFSIDAELLVDADGQPQALNLDQSTLSTPSNLHRVAVMCIGFNDTLLDSSSNLIGPKKAEFRILRSLGFVVVPVHQNVIPVGTTSLNRVKFLQNLITSHLREPRDA